MIGEQFGDWLLQEELTATFHGQRYVATTRQNSARLAIVQLLAKLAPPFSEFESAFAREVTTLTKMSHPHVVTYYGGGLHEQQPYLVTEHLDGTDYQTLLRQGERPSWSVVLGHALQLVAALRHTHRRGILHGDLKPENVIRLPDGSVKLAACGLAKLHPIDLTPNNSNPLASAAFISPEQASGKPGTKRSDFYSLGCLLYALLTGRPPFIAGNVAELIHKHCFVLPERPTHYAPDLPHEIDAFILRLLAKDPQNRPGSGTLMLEELERLWALFEARGQLPKRDPLPMDGPPSPLASRLRDAEQPLQTIPEELPRPLFSRPLVVLPMFLVVVAMLIVGFAFSSDDADELYAKAAPLMQSSDPADWEKAWYDYLEPLSRRYPNSHTEQVNAFRAKVEPLAELRRSQVTGRTVKYGSEAERFYNMGLRLTQAGDNAGARKMWERTIIVFGQHESEQRWVNLCRQALERTATEFQPNRPSRDQTIQQLITQAHQARDAGRTKEADLMLDALEALYAAEPDFAEIRPLIEQARMR